MRRSLVGCLAALLAFAGVAAAADKDQKNDAPKPVNRISVPMPERVADEDWKRLERSNRPFFGSKRDELGYVPVDVLEKLGGIVRTNGRLAAIANSPNMVALFAARVVKPAAIAELDKEQQEEFVKACAPDVLPEELAALVGRLGLNYRNATPEAITRALETHLRQAKQARDRFEKEEARDKEREQQAKERARQEKRKEREAEDKRRNVVRSGATF